MLSKWAKKFFEFEMVAFLVFVLLFISHPEEWVSHLKFFGALSVGISIGMMSQRNKE